MAALTTARPNTRPLDIEPTEAYRVPSAWSQSQQTKVYQACCSSIHTHGDCDSNRSMRAPYRASRGLERSSSIGSVKKERCCCVGRLCSISRTAGQLTGGRSASSFMRCSPDRCVYDD